MIGICEILKNKIQPAFLFSIWLFLKTKIHVFLILRPADIEFDIIVGNFI